MKLRRYNFSGWERRQVPEILTSIRSPKVGEGATFYCLRSEDGGEVNSAPHSDHEVDLVGSFVGDAFWADEITKDPDNSEAVELYAASLKQWDGNVPSYDHENVVRDHRGEFLYKEVVNYVEFMVPASPLQAIKNQIQDWDLMEVEDRIEKMVSILPGGDRMQITIFAMDN